MVCSMPGAPALEGGGDVDAGELLEDGVVLLVAEHVEERAELGAPTDPTI